MTESSDRFEWDNEKNSINIKKHEIDLSDIPEITKEQWKKGYFKNKPALSVSIDGDNVSWLEKIDSSVNEYTVNKILRWARQNGYPVAVQG